MSQRPHQIGVFIMAYCISSLKSSILLAVHSEAKKTCHMKNSTLLLEKWKGGRYMGRNQQLHAQQQQQNQRSVGYGRWSRSWSCEVCEAYVHTAVWLLECKLQMGHVRGKRMKKQHWKTWIRMIHDIFMIWIYIYMDDFAGFNLVSTWFKLKFLHSLAIALAIAGLGVWGPWLSHPSEPTSDLCERSPYMKSG